MGVSRIYRRPVEKAVIFTANKNFINIYQYLNDRGNSCSVVIPESRLGTNKIKEIQSLCISRNIEVLVHPKKGSSLKEFHSRLIEQGYTFALAWSYSQILAKDTLELFTKGIWNMHGGKIPEYRGNNVLQWAIVNGEEKAGVTWHIMDERIDHGPILKEGTVPIEPADTAVEVREKITQKGFELFCRLWEEAGSTGILPYEVDMEKGYYWKSRNPFDGIIHSDMAEDQIRNLIRAQCPPWPAPFAVHEGKVFRIHGTASQQGDGVIEYRNKKCSMFLAASLEKDMQTAQEVLRREHGQ